MTKAPLERLERLKEEGTAPVFRETISMGSCSLLESAIVSSQQAVSIGNAIAEQIRKIKVEETEACSLGVLVQYLARLELITAILGNAREECFLDSVRKVIEATEKAWNYCPHSLDESSIPIDGTPYFMPPIDQVNRDYNKYFRYLNDFVIKSDTKNKWHNPGLLLAGAILRVLSDRQQPKTSYKLETNVVFAVSLKNPIGQLEKAIGMLGKLIVKRVPGGNGHLIADPFFGGYLSMASKSFCQGLQNAQIAARGYINSTPWGSNTPDYDWIWSIDLANSRSAEELGIQNSLQIPIKGRSGEVAITCALIAAAAGNPDVWNCDPLPLDPHSVATAMFDTQSNEWKEGRYFDLNIKPVGSIDIKTLMGPSKPKRITCFLISSDQPEGSLPNDPKLEFNRCSNLKQAYDSLRRFPAITKRVNQQIAKAATEVLEQTCKPYIQPEIAIQDEQGQIPEHNKLDKERLALIKSGDFEAAVKCKRIWMCAESGLGKSTLVIDCQKNIAESNSALIPIRFGRTKGTDFALSAVGRWEDFDAEQLLQKSEISDHLNAAYPNDALNALGNQDRLEWIQWAWKNGSIVFLFDALDQTDREMQDLGFFLQNASVSHFSVLVTGRPETQVIQARFFRGSNRWRKLTLLPFDEERQRDYLGEKLSESLIPSSYDDHWTTTGDENERRRRHLYGLLGVPLILHFIKELAVRDVDSFLGQLSSKYRIYDKVIDYFLDQASAKIEDPRALREISGVERKLMERIAWFMLKKVGLTGQLEGDALLTLKKKLNKASVKSPGMVDRFELLSQYNIAILNLKNEDLTGLRPSSERFSFRHQSFLEFFAGTYFGRMFSDNKKTRFLESIHTARSLLDERKRNPESNQFAAFDQLTALGCSDILRFSLSSLEDSAIRNRLAQRLIELGNPWIVFEAILKDNLELDSDLDAFCRILVSQNWTSRFNYKKTLDQNAGMNRDFKKEAIEAVKRRGVKICDMLSREFRDSGYITSLRGLVGEGVVHTVYSRESFLRDRLKTLPCENGKVWDFDESFYHLSASDYGLHPSIKTFCIADFPVTNALYELFCPKHWELRNQDSDRDDDPVLQVSHWMAQEFCDWLSVITGKPFRLPTDDEWRWAVSWHGTRKERFWWSSRNDYRLCWCLESKAQRTRSRTESIVAHVKAGIFHPSKKQNPKDDRHGLLDLHGNVWEWMSNSRSESRNEGDARDGDKILLGGSWKHQDIYAELGFHANQGPINRTGSSSFRVVY